MEPLYAFTSFRVVFPAVYVLVKHSTRLRVLMNGALEKVYKYIVSGCKSVHDAVIYIHITTTFAQQGILMVTKILQ